MVELRTIGGADTLVAALHDARAVELELLDGLTDAEMLGPRGHNVWEWVEDRNVLAGFRTVAC